MEIRVKKNIGVALKMLHPAVAERQRATVGELVGGEVLLRIRGSRRMSSTMVFSSAQGFLGPCGLH